MPDDDAREDAHKNGDTRVEEEEKEKTPPPDDEVAAAVVERFPGAVFHRSHGQPVVYVDRVQRPTLADIPIIDQQCAQHLIVVPIQGRAKLIPNI